MADQTVGELMRATSIGPTDLFVAEQGGVAKSVSGQIFMNWLVSFADGHGGIHNFEKIKTAGLTDTYRITLADTTTFDFTVNNGKSITSIAKTGTQGLVDTYTISYNDGPSTTFTVTNGEKGDKGDNAYAWVKYASQNPSESSHSIGDIPDNWIGVYTGNKSSAPSDWKEYKWFQWKGDKGDTGEPARLESSEVVYQVGDRGDIIPSGSWQSNIPNAPQGKYLWTRTTNRFNTGNPVISYTVSHQGLDGSGSVSSVAGISPGQDGNVPLTAAHIKALPTAGGTMTGPIDMGGQSLIGLNLPENDNDAVSLGYVRNSVDTLGISGASRANSVVVERNLGTVFTPEQSADIRSGKFDIVRTGCYWTINGHKYWAAHADYRLHCGDTELTTHHMLVIPDMPLFNHVMNDTNDTTGAYYGSKMKASGLVDALATIKTDFGSDHILTHKVMLTNAIKSGTSSGWAWYDSQIDLMNEHMVYGSYVWGGGTQNGYDTGSDKSQLALFQARPDLIVNRKSWWIRDIRSTAAFCCVASDGRAYLLAASDTGGVRPAWLIY